MINNNTKSCFIYILYTVVDTRRAFGNQKIAFSLHSYRKTLVNIYKKGSRMGFNDMLKGIAFTSDFCNRNNYYHKIYRKEPFDFETYFKPLSYDWRINLDEIQRQDRNSMLFLSMSHIRNERTEYRALKFFSRLNYVKYLCVSISAPCSVDLFSEKFHSLYQITSYTSALLEKQVSLMKANNGWVSVSFRFANLLGDSDERIRGISTLSPIDRDVLMKKCSSKLIELTHSYSSDTVFFITSDSNVFLHFISELNIPNFHFILIGGITHHIGFGSSCGDEAIDKMICEYLIISKSIAAYQVRFDPMYNSQFPRYAASIDGIPYSLISD